MKQIVGRTNGFPGFWLIRGKYVIEGSIFTDDYDDMFDRSGGGGLRGRILSGAGSRSSEIYQQSKQARTHRKVLSGLRQKTGRRHDFLLKIKGTTEAKVEGWRYSEVNRG